MASRLGDVLYWIGCLFTAVFVAGGVAMQFVAIPDHEPVSNRLFLTFSFIILAVGAWLIGRAAKYVLAGR